jgi:hypothetical protein
MLELARLLIVPARSLAGHILLLLGGYCSYLATRTRLLPSLRAPPSSAYIGAMTRAQARARTAD